MSRRFNTYPNPHAENDKYSMQKANNSRNANTRIASEGQPLNNYPQADSSEMFSEPPNQTAPERNFLAGYLDQAIRDLIWPESLGGNDYGKTPPSFRRWNIRRSTRVWFDSNKTHPMSFRWVCEHLYDSEDSYLAIRKELFRRAAVEIPQLEEADKIRIDQSKKNAEQK